MSLFSKFRTAPTSTAAPGSPEPVAAADEPAPGLAEPIAAAEPAPAAPEPVDELPPAWTMGKEEYDNLIRKLANIAENVGIVNDNVRLAIRKIDTLQSDMSVGLNNEIILGNDQDKLIASVKGIGYTIDRVERLLENLSK